jgi:hypothetical protein
MRLTGANESNSAPRARFTAGYYRADSPAFFAKPAP